jgi:DNA polymerase-3 subunit epsilon
MKPNLILLHCECCNQEFSAASHIILVPVINGERQPSKEYILNPQTNNFEWIQSGISQQTVEAAPTYAKKWGEIENILTQFPIIVSSSDGYAMRVLHNTLHRLHVAHAPLRYCNAKAIIRKMRDQLFYNFDILCDQFAGDIIDVQHPVEIAERWADLVLHDVESYEADTIDDLLSAERITVGSSTDDEFIPSLTKSQHSHNVKFDTDAVEVHADSNNPFFGMSVVFTGKLEGMTRAEARTKVITIGGEAPERLTQDVNYLVVGTQDLRVVGQSGLSGKMKTAAKYREKGCPIEVITEQDFVEMINS